MSSARQQRLGWPCSFPSSSSSSSSSVWVEVRVVDFGGSAARHGGGDGDCGAGFTAMSKRSMAWRINPATGGWLVHWTDPWRAAVRNEVLCMCFEQFRQAVCTGKKRNIYSQSLLALVVGNSAVFVSAAWSFFPRRVTGPVAHRANRGRNATSLARLREVAGGNPTPGCTESRDGENGRHSLASRGPHRSRFDMERKDSARGTDRSVAFVSCVLMLFEFRPAFALFMIHGHRAVLATLIFRAAVRFPAPPPWRRRHARHVYSRNGLRRCRKRLWRMRDAGMPGDGRWRNGPETKGSALRAGRDGLP